MNQSIQFQIIFHENNYYYLGERRCNENSIPHELVSQTKTTNSELWLLELQAHWELAKQLLAGESAIIFFQANKWPCAIVNCMISRAVTDLDILSNIGNYGIKDSNYTAKVIVIPEFTLLHTESLKQLSHNIGIQKTYSTNHKMNKMNLNERIENIEKQIKQRRDDLEFYHKVGSVYNEKSQNILDEIRQYEIALDYLYSKYQEAELSIDEFAVE